MVGSVSHELFTQSQPSDMMCICVNEMNISVDDAKYDCDMNYLNNLNS